MREQQISVSPVVKLNITAVERKMANAKKIIYSDRSTWEELQRALLELERSVYQLKCQFSWWKEYK
jgi:hypothetical protein